MRRRALVVAALLAGLGCHSPAPPRPTAPPIFDEHADGEALVGAALERAVREDRYVMLFFGANWCPYCWRLHALLDEDSAVREIVGARFVVVPIDVGTSQRNRNTELIDRYEAPVFTRGTPAIVILDAEGRCVAPTDDNPWPDSWSEPGRLSVFLERATGRADQSLR